MVKVAVMGNEIFGIAQVYELKKALHKVSAANTEPYFESTALNMPGAVRLKEPAL